MGLLSWQHLEASPRLGPAVPFYWGVHSPKGLQQSQGAGGLSCNYQGVSLLPRFLVRIIEVMLELLEMVGVLSHSFQLFLLKVKYLDARGLDVPLK